MTISMKPLTVFAPRGEEPDPKALKQIEMVMRDERAVAGALCADHHLGYSMPIGGVVAYDGAISPSGVGYDIACGNKAVRTNVAAHDLGFVLPQTMDAIQERISFGMGRSNPTPVDHDLFDQHAGTLHELDRLVRKRGSLTQKARAQLGTVGAGNHYVDLLADDDGWVWIANHFGSRGLGHTIASGFLNLAHNKPWDERGKERDEATVLPLDTELGVFYVAAMRLAGDYAYAGRDYVCDEVLTLLGAKATYVVHNHHNFAWLEDGLWVVRKGATPLTEAPAFIGGSMGDGAVIVRGRTDSQGVVDVGALGSAPHGAGRVMSRTAAAGKRKRSNRYGCTDRSCDYWISPQTRDQTIRANKNGGDVYCERHPHVKLRKFTHFEKVSEGLIDWPGTQLELRRRGIELRGAGADEAPGVYKSLDDVIEAHPNVEVVERLRPLGVVMAGPDVYDPYKD